MDSVTFRTDSEVNCWVGPERRVVVEFEGRHWDIDTLAISQSLGMPLGVWWKHVQRVQRYLDAAPDVPSDVVFHHANYSARSRQANAMGAPDLAVMFASDPISRVRVGAAQATADPVLLGVLSGDRVNLVRQAVATNAHTPEEHLTVLAGDEHPDVRARVAMNPHCPPDVYAVLLADRRAIPRIARLTDHIL